MSEFNKYSTDGGATFIDVEDSNAVHYGDQSKGYVGKNLLKHELATTLRSNITWTVNADGTITSSSGTVGSTRSDVYLISEITGAEFKKRFGTNTLIKLSGCPSGGSNTSYFLRLRKTPYSVVVTDVGSGITFNTSNIVDTDIYSIECNIDSNKTVSEMVWKPMITLASVPDSDYAHYEPYIHPNTEIPDKMTYADNTVLGAKNLLPFPYVTSSGSVLRNVTFTYDDDGVINVDGTCQSGGNANCVLLRDTGKNLQWLNGAILNGCINGSENTYRLIVVLDVSPWTTYTTQTNDDVIIKGIPNTDDLVVVLCSVKDGATVSNVKIKPMIRLAGDTDDTYAPYAKTNKEITNQINSFYAKYCLIPANGSVTITAVENYQQLFAFGQRNVALLFWSLTDSATSAPLVENVDTPTVSFVENKVTRLTNVAGANMKFLIMSYKDFTIS